MGIFMVSTSQSHGGTRQATGDFFFPADQEYVLQVLSAVRFEKQELRTDFPVL
jgi:hypothetical protein